MSKRPPKRRILIVGEGRETEYNYFVGFRKHFESDLELMATSISVKRGNGGDAKSIVENAAKEAVKFEPDVENDDRVFLLMDTEGAGRSPELPNAEKLAKQHNIEIIYSSPAIEYWLLCHFIKAKRSYFKNCDAVIVELNKHWEKVCASDYDKSDQDIFVRLADRFPLACEQSLEIDLHHIRTVGVARKKNPSSQIYELIAFLIGAKSGKKCPIAGEWTLVFDNTIKIQLQKGEIMPEQSGSTAHWRL